MSVLFNQYLRPHGRIKEILIERGQAVEDIAGRFIKSGGVYQIEVLMDGQVYLTACKENVDPDMPLTSVMVPRNGPEVVQGVDDLVRQSEEFI